MLKFPNSESLSKVLGGKMAEVVRVSPDIRYFYGPA